MEQKINTTQCKTCLYQTNIYLKKKNSIACFYLGLTGNRRPCEPSPNCTVWEKYDYEKYCKLMNSDWERVLNATENI